MYGDLSWEAPKNTYGIIYVLISPSGKRYVGQTTQKLESRWRHHVHDALYSNDKTIRIYRAIRKYGAEKFGKLIVATAMDKEGLDAAEQHYIEKFNTLNRAYGYNLKGGGARGGHSKETKQLMRELKLGKPLSETHKNNIAKYMRTNAYWKGKHLTKEAKEKLRNAHLGLHASELTKAKMSEAHKGQNNYFYDKHFTGSANPFYGKHHSEVTRAKMVAAWQRRKENKCQLSD